MNLFEPFGTGLSALGVAVAVTGIAAVILFAVGRHAAPSPLATWAAFAVLRILVAPVLAPTVLVCAIFSPHRSPRLVLLAATVTEVAVSAYGGVRPLVVPAAIAVPIRTRKRRSTE